jgi:hypothetical protein
MVYPKIDALAVEVTVLVQAEQDPTKKAELDRVLCLLQDASDLMSVLEL